MNSNNSENYLDTNKILWEARLNEHIQSDFYDMDSFLKGRSTLNDIELDLLGDIKGKSVLHLQCHFGQDTISLSKMGAKLTGVDFSAKTIQKAAEFATQLNADIQFICSDIYALTKQLNKQFDLIFTSYGTITWLPNLDRWAQVVSRFLKPGGKLVFADFHPFIWMFDDDIKNIIYPYNSPKPIVEVEQGTYANTEAQINLECITWNHGIGEVVNSLINHQLTIESLKEYDYSPYPFVNNCTEYEAGKYRIEHFDNKVPLVYSITAIKS